MTGGAPARSVVFKSPSGESSERQTDEIPIEIEAGCGTKRALRNGWLMVQFLWNIGILWDSIGIYIGILYGKWKYESGEVLFYMN